MQVVLVEPEIPQNTGSIARTCAATGSHLHLVGKLGFEITEKRVRRAGLDYWPHVKFSEHASWEDFEAVCNPKDIWIFTKFAKRPYYDAAFSSEATLVFGSETRGLGTDFIARFPEERSLLIPMACPEVRSLNLSNAVSIALYDALRQTRMI